MKVRTRAKLNECIGDFALVEHSREDYKHAGLGLQRVCRRRFLTGLRGMWHRIFSTSLLRGHCVRRSRRKVCAPILDQPVIAVADSHIEKADGYGRYRRPIGAVDVAHGKDRVRNRNIGLDEADPIIRERRLRGAVYGMLCLWTEFVHHCNVPIEKVTLWRHKRSILSEQGCPGFGILLKEILGEAISERANGCFVSSLGRRSADRSDDKRRREKG